MNLDFIGTGIQSIYSNKNELYTQSSYLDLIMKQVRDSTFEMIKLYKCVFIVNESYLLKFFSREILNPMYGFYNYHGECNVTGSILIPILSIDSKVAGYFFVNPIIMEKAKKENDYSVNYYKFPRKEVFNTSNQTLMLPQVYRRALVDDYIIFIDGTFDTMNLTSHGLNAAGFLGSYISSLAVAPFRLINKHYVIKDNDEAGVLFHKRLKKYFPFIKEITQSKYGDIDDYLKYAGTTDTIKKIKEGVDFYRNIQL